MQRIWHSDARMVLLGVALIEVVTFLNTEVVDRIQHQGAAADDGLFWSVLALFLVWRIWRRGALARWILITLNVLPLLLVAIGTGRPTWYLAVPVTLTVLELVLLFSPAVRRHVTGSPHPADAPGTMPP